LKSHFSEKKPKPWHQKPKRKQPTKKTQLKKTVSGKYVYLISVVCVCMSPETVFLLPKREREGKNPRSSLSLKGKTAPEKMLVLKNSRVVIMLQHSY